ncbi:MAG: helix-turn-helix domain-containing protein [Burkholderiaceae bacterium]
MRKTPNRATAATPTSPGPNTPGAAEAPSLAQALQQLIEKTLAANNGNVARTARLLGVSRGMVYRHLKRSALAQDDTT